MFSLLLSLPVLALIFFYAWALSLKFGAVIGIHLAMLVVSFFYLCTPISSYLYVLGCLPGNTHRESRGGVAIVAWVFLGIFNAITVYALPSIYKKTIITTVFYNILLMPVARYTVFVLSLGTLLYHWMISHIRRPMVRRLAHVLGILVSAFVLWNLYWLYRDTFVITLNSTGLNY
ncbi:hypothetical protein KAU11_00900 [Candidatus Babeliales bacterium]|nr:hypothetical protein [Candidatus Babeliales bacterium]